MLIGKITKQELFDNRPFKFEKYRSYEEFDKAVELYFSIGGNVDEMEDDLRRSGAECYSYKVEDPIKPVNYDTVINCDYLTGFFSLYYLENYGISLGTDKNRKLIAVYSQRTTGIH